MDFDAQPVNLYATELTYCEPHWHRAPELMVVLTGKFVVWISNKSRALEEGGLVFVNSDELHTLHSLERGSKLLAVQFAPTVYSNCEKSLTTDLPLYVSTFGECSAAERDVFKNVVLLARLTMKDGFSRRYALLQHIYGLLDAMEKASRRTVERDPVDLLHGSGHVKEVELAKQAIAFVSERYAEDIRLLDVAEALRVGYYQLSRTFNAITGFNFREYLTLLRLNIARAMLRDESVSITLVSEQSGFPDHRSLNVAFQKYLSMTPTQYRKKVLSHLPQEKQPGPSGINRLLSDEELDSLLTFFESKL
ncbi:AraC family transcriptional regulator [Burkholderia sp. LMG 21824]|uniref:AraC family transcriptional regulator n=1 Tax=Burkholderia sp. LMG 21824 TaxID=3158172 RepID=UPI003C2B59BB